MSIDILPDGKCAISAMELQASVHAVQATYRILKEKGAPIIGGCCLLLDPRYRWFVLDNPKDKSTEFKWEYKEE